NAGQDTIAIPAAPGNTGNADKDQLLVDVIDARPKYVEVMGMRLLAGRSFNEKSSADVREALIDGHLAKQFFPTGSPIGAAIPFRGSSLTIVGVVEQARLYELHQDGRPQLFLRAEDWGYRSPFFVLRTDREPSALIPEVRALVRQIDPRVAIA